MNRLILASTSTLHAQDYLAYLLPELQSFFQGTDCIVFVPYARPNGMSEEAVSYTHLTLPTKRIV